MDHTEELESIRAENFALQSLVCGLLTGLKESGNAPLAQGAFTVSDLLVETLAMRSSGDMGRHLQKSLKALEEMREIVFGPADTRSA